MSRPPGFEVVEGNLTPWSAKVEYNYMDFGSDRFVFNDVVHSDPGFSIPGIDQQIHTVKIGLNWRWGGARH